jgi:hypothetical protein
VLFDPIPQDVMLGESFILRASVPESVKKKFPEDTQLILGIVPQPDPDEFSYSSPLDIFEAISKEGGKWEWKFKAKQHGKRLEIDFRVGVVKNNLIEDNCIIPIFIDIKNKPFYLIIWTPLLKYVIYPLVALLGWLFATIPTLRNWLDSLVAKLFKSKPKNNQ